jgi:hypothetical protein
MIKSSSSFDRTCFPLRAAGSATEELGEIHVAHCVTSPVRFFPLDTARNPGCNSGTRARAIPLAIWFGPGAARTPVSRLRGVPIGRVHRASWSPTYSNQTPAANRAHSGKYGLHISNLGSRHFHRSSAYYGCRNSSIGKEVLQDDKYLEGLRSLVRSVGKQASQ